MPVPAEVMFDILQLGLTTSDTHTLRRCSCLVLCYCWYNHADSGVLLLRRHVIFDASFNDGMTPRQQGPTTWRRLLVHAFRLSEVALVHHRLMAQASSSSGRPLPPRRRNLVGPQPSLRRRQRQSSCITASGSPWPRCSSISLFMCSPALLLISS